MNGNSPFVASLVAKTPHMKRSQASPPTERKQSKYTPTEQRGSEMQPGDVKLLAQVTPWMFFDLVKYQLSCAK